MQRSSAPRRAPRRNNAPLRPRRPATSVPDVLFAFAVTGWTMAVAFTAASFFDPTVTSGAAGAILARLFSAALAVCSLFAFLLGLVLLRDERTQPDHYVAPAVLGVAIGGAEAVLFLWPADRLLFVPLIFIVFAFRPIRRLAGRLLRPAGSRYR